MDGIERVILKMFPSQDGRNKYLVFSMQQKWEKICGESVAKHSKPVRLERKILYINTDSSVWANHLLMMKQQFINNINKVMENNPVKDIKFFTGSVKKYISDSSINRIEKLQFKPLTEDEKDSILNSVKNIKNEDLQKSIIGFRKHSLQRKKALINKNDNKKCQICGSATLENEVFCRVCFRYEKEKLREKIVAMLIAEPWLNYEYCQKYIKCDKILFDSVKNSLKQHYYDKVYNNQASAREEMIAVMLKTGMHPEKITELLAENIIKGLRRK